MNRLLVLDPRRFVRLDGPRRLQVTQGLLWLTVDRDPTDHLLARGDRFELPRGGHALLQALDGPARACVEAPERGWQRLARALRRPLHALLPRRTA